MEEHENLYEKIREILGGSPGKMRILEQQIDMDLQMEYYECSRKMREEMDEEQALKQARYLDEPGYSLLVKKEILAGLAAAGGVRTYRVIEAYMERVADDLKQWTMLALNENRMNLESRLLDESQVFISTGLGGNEEKLRYFVVLISKGELPLGEHQKKIISNEFDFILKKYDADIEEVNYSDYLATLLLLIPMEHSLKMVFHEAIDECNKYGDFLKEDFIVTNVKTLSFEEIKEHLNKEGDSA